MSGGADIPVCLRLPTAGQECLPHRGEQGLPHWPGKKCSRAESQGARSTLVGCDCPAAMGLAGSACEWTSDNRVPIRPGERQG